VTTSRGRRGASSRSAWRDDRVWQAGFLVGSAIGAAATVLGRRAERAARRGLVDWAGAERVAVDRLKTVPGSLSAAELRATEPLYAAAMERIVPRLSEALGTALPSGRRSSTGPAGSTPTSRPSPS